MNSDIDLIAKSLVGLDGLLSYLKNLDPSKVNTGVKSHLNIMYEKFGYLLSYWEIHGKKGYFEHKIDESLWQDNCLLRYLFEDCITYKDNKTTGNRDLFCTVCNVDFVCESSLLVKHLEDLSHLANFGVFRNQTSDLVYGDLYHNRFAFEKFIDVRVDKTLYCRICAVVIPATHINLMGHLNGSKHKRNFNDMFNYKFDCSRNADSVNLERSTNFQQLGMPASNIPHYLPKMPTNDKTSGVSVNKKTVDQTSMSCESSSKVTSPLGNLADNQQNKVFQLSSIKLQNALKLFIKKLLKNPSQYIIDKKNILGLYCYPCDYCNINDVNSFVWLKHLSTEWHDLCFRSKPNCKSVNCDCFIQIIGDEQFISNHVASEEHKIIMRFITRKLQEREVPKVFSSLDSDSAGISTSAVVTTCPSVSDSSSIHLNDSKNDSHETVEFMSEEDSDVASVASTASSARGGGLFQSQPNKKIKMRSDRQGRKRPKNVFYWYGLTGLSPDVSGDDIKQAFTQFGDVEFIQILDNTSMANVKVKLRDELKNDGAAISGSGVTVSIKGVDYEVKEKNFEDIEFPPEIVLTNFIQNQNTFFESLYRNAVKEADVSLSVLGKSVNKRKTVEFDLQKALQEKLQREIAVVTIGSRATGLALSDSFHDIFVNIDCYEDDLSDRSKLVKRQTAIEESLKNSEVPRFKNVKIDGDFVYAEHCLTKFNCKIFCGNGLVVENTELIRSYVTANEIIRKLIIIIKEWAKHTDLPKLTTNYAVTWMVLYYLMQPNVNFIKPVIGLKSSYKGSIRSIAGWECGFSSALPTGILRSDRILKSVHELLIGFFQFYSRRNFIMYVHCPLTGNMYLKSDFEKLKLPALPFENYIRLNKSTESKQKKFQAQNGIFCLQDPLELNRNLIENISSHAKKKFQIQCQKMCNILS